MMDTTQSQTPNRGTADTSLAQGGAPHTCCGGPAPSGQVPAAHSMPR